MTKYKDLILLSGKKSEYKSQRMKDISSKKA